MSTPRRSSTLRSPNATGRGIGAAVACLAWWCLFAGGCSVTVSETSSSDVTGTGEPAPTTMRVATYNIRHGRGTDEVLDLGRTARAIAALDADIVALQEVDEQVGRSGGVDEAATLGRALGMHHAFGSFMDYDGGRYGLAILSRWPIESATTWRLPTGNEPRVALAIDVDPPGIGPCTIVDVHFDWVQDDGFRFAQAEAVAERLATLDRPWILLGDFNDTPGTRTRRLLAGLGIEGRSPEDGSNTWPATAPTVDIDTIIAGPGDAWSGFGRRVGSETMASDHRPVTAELGSPRRP
jgi:endonuclease/exonuclease/phosphatase family metal-dependent hydrolase